MNDRLLNVDEVKEYLNISKAAVYQYARSQTMPSIKLNGRLLFSKPDLEAWLQTKKQPVTK